MLTYGHDAKSTHLETSLFCQDEPDTATANVVGSDPEKDKSGYKRRKARVENSKKIFFVSGLHCDFFQSVRLLPSGVNLRVKLSRNNDSFSVMAASGNYKIKVDDLKLSIGKVKVSPDILIKHQQQFKIGPAIFPFSRAKISTHTIPKGVDSYEISEICSGLLPQQIIIGMIDHDAYSGGWLM